MTIKLVVNYYYQNRTIHKSNKKTKAQVLNALQTLIYFRISIFFVFSH
jgi:hypothetical protein